MDSREHDQRRQRILILLVDDDPDFAAEMLAILGVRHDVTLAADSAAALQKVRDRKFDIAFVDLHLPRLLAPHDSEEGLALIRLLSEQHHMRVVAITSSAGRDLEERCLIAGAAAFERKENLSPERLASYLPVQQGKELS